MNRTLYIYLILLAAGCLIAFKTPGSLPLQAISISGEAQGTTYNITYYAGDSTVVKKQIDSIFNSIDSSLSIYKSYSKITAFNNADREVEMDMHLKQVVTRSLQITKYTKGISDITVYPLMSIWGFGPKPDSIAPDAKAVEHTLYCVGAAKLLIKENRLIKTVPCLKIDVNGIAQGYSVDVLARWLELNNIHNYLVEVGGELRVKGRKYPGGKKLRIGIEAPARNTDDVPIIRKIIEIEKGAITTSGNYRKYHEVNGQKVTHLLSPITGYPFTNDLISVTVWAKDAITADGYDNALMGMGMLKAINFLRKRNDIQAYFIYRDENGTVRDTATSGFYKMMVKE